MATPLGPGSLAWRLGYDRRVLLLIGRALLMQVMHPTIGAGVNDFSQFRADPWGRLDRSVRSLMIQLFGGQRAVTEAKRLRELHRSIKGIGFHGERYSALNPEPYAWTHLTNFDTALKLRGLLAAPLADAQQRQLYADWRQAGLVLGILDQHLPVTLDDFRSYLDEVVETRLEATPTARKLLESFTLTDVPPPPWKLFPKALWGPLRPVGRIILYDTTVGTLPAVLRDRLGLDWTERQERRLRLLATVVRTAAPLVPDRLLEYPLGYQAKQAARRYVP